MNISPTLEANAKTTEFVEPRMSAFDHPVSPAPTARTDDESTAAREKSSWPASRSFASSNSCSRTHTPALCQSRKHCQKVGPEPNPNACLNAVGALGTYPHRLGAGPEPLRAASHRSNRALQRRRPVVALSSRSRPAVLQSCRFRAQAR